MPNENIRVRSAEGVDETDLGPIETSSPEIERPGQSLHVTDEVNFKKPTNLTTHDTCEENREQTNTSREDSAPPEQIMQNPVSGDHYKLTKSLEEAPVEYQPNGHEGNQCPPESTTRTRRSDVRVQNLDHEFVNQPGSIDQDSKGLSSDSEEAPDGSPPKWHGQITGPPRGTLQNAFNQMRPRRISPQLATITIGSKTTTTILPPFATRERATSNSPPAQEDAASCVANKPEQRFSSSMSAFALIGNEGIRSSASQLRNPLSTSFKPPKGDSQSQCQCLYSLIPQLTNQNLSSDLKMIQVSMGASTVKKAMKWNIFPSLTNMPTILLMKREEKHKRTLA